MLKRAWSAEAAADDKSDMPDFQVKLFTEMEKGLSVLKQDVENKLGLVSSDRPPISLGKNLKHYIVKVPCTVPSIAMSSWSNGLAYRCFPTPNGLLTEIIPQWGCTVYPVEKEHVVVFHYFLRDKRTFTRTIGPLRNAETSVILQRRVTQLLLGRFEDLVIAPNVWEAFPERRQQAIRDYFLTTIPELGLESAVPPAKPFSEWDRRHRRLVNLFVS